MGWGNAAQVRPVRAFLAACNCAYGHKSRTCSPPGPHPTFPPRPPPVVCVRARTAFPFPCLSFGLSSHARACCVVPCALVLAASPLALLLPWFSFGLSACARVGCVIPCLASRSASPLSHSCWLRRPVPCLSFIPPRVGCVVPCLASRSASTCALVLAASSLALPLVRPLLLRSCWLSCRCRRAWFPLLVLFS